MLNPACTKFSNEMVFLGDIAISLHTLQLNDYTSRGVGGWSILDYRNSKSQVLANFSFSGKSLVLANFSFSGEGRGRGGGGYC